MGAVYLIIAILFVLVCVAIAGGIYLAKESKKRKQYESMAEEKLRIDRERLELEKKKAEKE
jgi:predicted permease